MRNRLIIFDLGGVLVRNQGCQKIISWSSRNMTVNDYNDEWIKSQTVREFEKGMISAEIFANRLIAEFDLVLSQEELMNEFSAFLVGLYEGTENFLTEISSKDTLATLSNTNSIQFSFSHHGICKT
jgi:putative hydrolase of the HAD superfamily